MNSILNRLKYLVAIALVVVAAGCAGNLLDKENVAVAAGFKVITPSKPDQVALLRKLPADKVTRTTYEGKTYYILPDRQNNQAYVGGPKQYQVYLQKRQVQNANGKDFHSPPPDIQVVEVNSFDWDGWDGWGPMSPMGEPGWY